MKLLLIASLLNICAGNYSNLVKIAKENNFIVTSIFGKHNDGSKHYEGKAIDVRTRDKTSLEIEKFISLASEKSIVVRDERERPNGQKYWTGSHLHLQIPDCKPIVRAFEEGHFTDYFLNMCSVEFP